MSKWRSAARDLVRYATAAPVAVPDATALGIAIVGVGRIGREAHLRAYAKAGFNVVGIYDPAPEAIELAWSRSSGPEDPQVALRGVSGSKGMWWRWRRTSTYEQL